MSHFYSHVAQVENVDNEKNEDNAINIWARIASSLSEIYLAPLLPKTPSTAAASRKSQRQVQAQKAQDAKKKTVTSPRVIDIKKPTIKEEILIHTSVLASRPTFAAKGNLDLKRIVSDQWRKDMVSTQQEDEIKRLEAIKQKREDEERKQAEILAKRKEKLKGRPTAELGPYSVKLKTH